VGAWVLVGASVVASVCVVSQLATLCAFWMMVGLLVFFLIPAWEQGKKGSRGKFSKQIQKRVIPYQVKKEAEGGAAVPARSHVPTG